MRTFYTVHTHAFGRPPIKSGPMQGCFGFPSHRWFDISVRPMSLEKAIVLADAQPHHAVVAQKATSTVLYDNGKVPELPEGWVLYDGDRRPWE